jgi:hypothetical protein
MGDAFAAATDFDPLTLTTRYLYFQCNGGNAGVA